jgi:copper resistance protein D
MAIILMSGLAVMTLFSAPTDYANSWALPYGQMLLLKHLAILPLLVAAFLNGFANKKNEPSKALLRLEAFMLLMVFVFTAWMSKLAPPHDIDLTFVTEGAAPLLDVLSGTPVLPINAQLVFSVNGVLLIAIGIMCFGLLVLSMRRKSSVWFGILWTLLFLVSIYTGLMMNLAF